MNFNLLSIVQIISIIQGVIFSILFLKEYKKNQHLFFFGLMILTYSLNYIPDLFENIGLTTEYPSLILFPFDFLWLTSVFLYIYVQKIPEVKNVNINYKSLYFAIFCTAIDFLLFFLPVDLKIKIVSSYLYALYYFLGIIYSYLFIILSFLFILKKKKEIKDKFYSFEFSEFKWAHNFVLILLILLTTTILILFPLYYICLYYSKLELADISFALIDLIFQFTLIIYGLKHKYSQNLYRDFIIKRRKNKIENKIEKEELENIISLLDKYLLETSVFTKSDLSITDISIALNIHSKKVSAALNSINSQNFNTYINQFRVEEAKKLLEKNKSLDYTIEGIGNMVGFNSKSVFYKEFKKNTGLTPMIYIENHIKNQIL